jgi:hypothetical protein
MAGGTPAGLSGVGGKGGTCGAGGGGEGTGTSPDSDERSISNASMNNSGKCCRKRCLASFRSKATPQRYGTAATRRTARGQALQ